MSAQATATTLNIYGASRASSLSLMALMALMALLCACDDDSKAQPEAGGSAGAASIAGQAGGMIPLAGVGSGGLTAGLMSAGDEAAGREVTAGVMSAGVMSAGVMMGGEEPSPSCEPGAIGLCYSETEQSVCDAEGLGYEPSACPEGQYCLNGQCGDMRCVPGMRLCSTATPNQILACDPNGLDWSLAEECPEGDACRGGVCVSGCEAASKLNTYIGCEYWTVDLDNYPDPFTVPMPNEVPHSVVISNPGELPAQLSFETRSGAAISVADPQVPPGEVRAFTMPRLDVDNSGISLNSIKVSSSMPVIAYQFNPLNNDNVFSNDASLLLPTNTLGAEYIVSSWPTGPNTENIIPTGIIPQAGYFTVVATSPGETEVTVTVTSATEAGPEVPALELGETASFRLQQFQVLNLQAAAFTPTDFFDLLNAPASDLTGSIVSATQPVAVFGGHEEAVIGSMSAAQGDDTCCADHLEEQLLPLQTWSDQVLCVKAKPRGSSSEIDVWRVISGADGNVISTDPPISGLNGLTLNKGEWVQVESPEAFKLTGTQPLQAIQYLISQGQTDEGKGDPSMILAVPSEQFRDQYNILVPDGYGEDWLTVIRPAGAELLLDGSPLSAPFTPIADGAWEFAYVAVSPGAHSVRGASPFGLIAYGWNNAVSYGYPAGLNLRNQSGGR